MASFVQQKQYQERAPSGDVTAMLGLWAQEDSPVVPEKIFDALYPSMHRIAKSLFVGEREENTLQATALVHECFLKLRAIRRVDWQGRVHFLSTATRLMRRILVDHARTTLAQKRGGDLEQASIETASLLPRERARELVALDDALFSLRRSDREKAVIVELHYFGGLSFDEIAAVLDLSRSTVFRQWKIARLRLLHDLQSRPRQWEGEPHEGHHVGRDLDES